MGDRKFLSYLVTLLLLVSLAMPADMVFSETLDDVDFAEGRVIVQFEIDLPEQARERIKNNANVLGLKNFYKKGLELVSIKGNRDVKETIEFLSKQKGVLFAEPDYLLQATYIPNDDYFTSLWGLYNELDIDIDATEAWDLTLGDNSVVVAVIDTGIQTNHKDLGIFTSGYDFYNNDTTVYDNVLDDHGTHVAGTIAAQDNSIGVIGVAPNVSIMPLKFLGPNGGYTSDAIEAIYYAQNNGAHIINASWGGGGYSQALKDAIEFFEGPFVAAAGNDGINTDSTPHYPSSYDSSNIISVASINENGDMSWFSNYGSLTVDIGAPGESILSTYPRNKYATMSGTSMATPHVSGVLALMKSLNMQATTDELITALYNSVDLLPSLDGNTQTGGLLNAHKALLEIGAVIKPTPPILIGTTPINGDIDVDINQDIIVSFDEDIIVTDNNNITINNILATTTVINNDLYINKDEVKTYLTDYTVIIPANSVTDMSDTPYESEINFNFTTMEEPVTPPEPQTPIEITRTKPGDNSSNVKTDSVFHFYFNQAITEFDVSKITFVDSSNNLVPYDVSIVSNSELVIIPTNNLNTNTSYAITLDSGAVSNATSTSLYYELNFTTGRR
ncbi:S8 family serine peptidase [Peptostreptococcaceae bacterium AGR-M142]